MSAIRLSAASAAALLAFGAIGPAHAQQANMTFFVTSVGSGKGADLGGLAGADAHCQQLAESVGAGGKTWRAYMSTNAAAPGGAVNARDRIGKGPWQNAKGVVIATSVDDLHSDNNKISKETGLTEKGTVVNGVGDTPNMHDMLTGSGMDGRAFPGNLNLTCNNWTSSGPGSAMLGHVDRRGNAETVFQHSWVAAHMSRKLQPARSRRHRRQRPVLLLRGELSIFRKKWMPVFRQKNATHSWKEYRGASLIQLIREALLAALIGVPKGVLELDQGTPCDSK